LDRVFVFHPDPWFKKRHHKRRVINESFLSLLKPKLTANAVLYVSTDVEPLWEAMMESIEASQLFTPYQDPAFWENSYHTHWQQFSQRENRTSFTGAFKIK
jgi:tRNA (guanine-N7-)-methyltransferase